MTRPASALVVFGLVGVMGAAEATSRVCYLDPGAAAAWQADDRAAAERQVRDAIKKYDAATLAMDADTIAAFFLPDGELWTNGTLTRRGPEAIRTFLRSFDGQARVKSQETTIDRVVWKGDHAIAEGTFHQVAHITASDSDVDARGHITFDWVRDGHGAWRIAKAATTPLAPGGLEVHR